MRYAPDKFFLSKISKGNNSKNIGQRVMALVQCTSPQWDLSIYGVSGPWVEYFGRYAPDKKI